MGRRLIGLLVVLAISWGGLAATMAAGITPRLGLDLQGGISVVLTAPEGTEPELIEVAVEIMRRRIEQFGGVQEPEIAVSGANTVLVQLPGVEDRERAIEAVGQTGSLSFHPVLSGPDDAESNRCSPADTPSEEGIAALPPLDPTASPALVVGRPCLLGGDVADAIPVFDPQGQWVVQLDLTSTGATGFADLTALAAGYPPGDIRRQIAVVLDGEVVTSPEVSPQVSPQTGISGGAAVITVGAASDAQQQATDTAVILRFGSLPVSFERSQVQTVSATLGSDALEAGIIAGLIGLALVAVFLVAFYRALGLVALVSLTVFGALLVAAFSLLGEIQGVALTVAGVTGIIVSVGITADAYIVYFERIKDELRAGLTAPEAAEVAFKSAFRTIMAGNIVSLLGAVFLWALTVGAVRGFALSLGVATLLGLFVIRAFTRRAVVVLAETPWGDGGTFSMAGAAR